MAKTIAYWGIDIGQCALKALRCRLDSDGQTVVADKYDYIEYPKILNSADADPDELIREALQQFLSRNDLHGDSVAISVPGQAGLSRFFKPPPVDAKTLPDIVKYEVKQQIPFPIEDVIWDWQQLGGTIVEGRTVDAEIGLFAMKREAVYRALKPFDDAEVKVDVIQLSPLAVFNVVCNDIIEDLPSAEDFDPENPPESLVVMSMGTDTTDLIVTNGIKLWLRNIPIGGNHFTKQLSRELKLTQAKAEHLKRNARQAEDPKTIFKAMRPVFTDLVNEVQRSLTFFQSMDKTAEISKIVLLGNAAKLPGLRQFLNKQLEIDIAKVTDFRHLKGDDVVRQLSFSDNLLSFAPAYGLCLQGIKRGKLKTNLLPIEIVTERIVRAKKPWVLASVGAIMLGLMLGYFFKENAKWKVDPRYTVEGTDWKKAQDAIQAQKTKSDSLKEADNKLKTRLGNLNRLASELTSFNDQRTVWIEVLSAIHQATTVIDEKTADVSSMDPTEYRFEDRDEIYIENIESKYMPELGDWFKYAKVEYDKMFEIKSADLLAQATADLKKTAESAGQGKEDQIKGPGWIIELKGFHFHNKDEHIDIRDSDKNFLMRTLVKNLIDGEVTFPDGKFKFQDFGLYYPTIVRDEAPRLETIRLVTAPGGQQIEDKKKSASDTTDESVQNAKKYYFWIQMAWIQRSPEQRAAAKAKRLEEEAKNANKDEAGNTADANAATAKTDADKSN